VVVGACLLAAGCVLGCVNRWREGGPRLALTDASALPGLMLLIGGGLVVVALATRAAAVEAAGFVLAAAALLAVTIGLRSEAGRGMAAVGVVLMGLLDVVVRCSRTCSRSRGWLRSG